MDVDTFMIFGLAFFVFVVWLVVSHQRSEEREQYNRRINEAREFGFNGQHKQNAPPPDNRK